MTTTTPYSAAGPLAGYVWQLRRALLALFDAGDGDSIELETRDDIVIRDAGGTLLAALQSKHSLNAGAMSTASVELWKTLRVWSYEESGGQLPPAAKFVLLSTDSVSAGTLFAPFADGSAGSNDIARLITALDRVAAAAGNVSLKKCYAAWNKLNPATKKRLLGRVTIEPAQPRLAATQDQLNQAIHHTGVRLERLAEYRERIVGWFDGLVDERLSKPACKITRDELIAKLIELHETFSPPHLPDTVGSLPIPQLSAEKAKDAIYLRQLGLVDASEAEQRLAVRMLHVARAQRQQWMDLRLTFPSQIDAFDDDIEAHWELVRAKKLRAIPAGEGAAKRVGRDILYECMEYQPAGLGTRVGTQVAVGSHHNLADRRRIGWHPEFLKRLATKGKVP